MSPKVEKCQTRPRTKGTKSRRGQTGSMYALGKYMILSLCWGFVGDWPLLKSVAGSHARFPRSVRRIEDILADSMNFYYQPLRKVNDSTAHPHAPRKEFQLTDEALTIGTDFFRKDLLGAEITVAIIHYPPYLDMKNTKSHKAFEISGTRAFGSSWELLYELSIFFNFTPKLVLPKVSEIGSKGKNGEWTGIMDLLHREEAMLTVMPVKITEDRRHAVAFSGMIGSETYGMLVKRPQFTPKPDALLRPFSNTVWILVVIATVTMGPLIYLIIVVRVKLCRGDPFLTRIFPVNDCVLFVYGAMMKQGSTIMPITDSSRILFATWWIFVMIVTSFYTANLTAFLTFNGLELPIKRVRDLEANTKVTWLASSDGALKDLILQSADPNMEILRHLKAEGRGRFTSLSNAVRELVRDGDHIFIDTMNVLLMEIVEDYKIQRNAKADDQCQFYMSPMDGMDMNREEKYKVWYAYAYAKSFEHKKIFSTFYKRIGSHGILHFFTTNGTSTTSVCGLPKGFKDRALENNDLLTTYIITLIGFGIAFIVFISEVVTRRMKRRKEKNRTQEEPKSFQNPETSSTFYTNQRFDIPTLEEEFVLNLPDLPEPRPRTPFELKYPSFSRREREVSGPLQPRRLRRSSFRSFASYSSDLSVFRTPTSRHHMSEVTTMETIYPRLPREFLSSPKQKLNRHSKYKSYMEAAATGLKALWRRRREKTPADEIEDLQDHVIYQDGVAYIYVQYVTPSGPRIEKMRLNEYLRNHHTAPRY
ncbi:uncharacterized protein LOC143024378 [Oratosquilla oratoria]|uniref:uncharacterized protein LOC143024378 n=1 Tax=Oratosquilla oratoria TaxID=337810 RepID=UPI003F75FFC0